MEQVHVHPDLLGATLRDTRGNKFTIMACWLEKQERDGLRPQFVVLIVGRDGECFKAYLPNTDYEVHLKET